MNFDSLLIPKLTLNEIIKKLKYVLLKYKYIILSINLFSIINFINFLPLLDNYSYIGFLLHLLCILFYLFNYKEFSLNLKKSILFLISLMILLYIHLIIKIKIIYSYDEEIILFRKRYIIFLISIVFIYILLYYKKFTIKYKNFITRLLFFFIILILYLSWGNTLFTLDIFYLITISFKLLFYSNLNLDEIGIKQKYKMDELLVPGEKLIPGKDEHFYSIFPLLPSILNAFLLFILKFFCIPFGSLKFKIFFISFLKENILNFSLLFQSQKTIAAIIAWLTAILFYNFLKNIGIKLSFQQRLFYVLLYSLGSIHWSISASNLWQHTYIEFFNLILILLFLKLIKIQKYYFIFFIGVLQGILFYIRPTTIFISFVYICVLFYLINKKNLKINYRKLIFYLIFGNLIIILPLAYLNFTTYGNPIGGYLIPILNPEYKKDVTFSFDNYFINFLGIFFSPNYGIFAFHPFFIISLIIFLFNFKKIYIKDLFKNHIVFISLVIIILYALFYSSNVQWTGFYNYGTRMFSDIIIYFFIIFIFILEKIKNNINIFFNILLNCSYLFAFIIQFYGTYSLHLLGDWYCDVHRKRDYAIDVQNKIWDIKDPLFFHKIWFRSQPLYKEKTVFLGEKICTLYPVKELNSYLLFDQKLIKKIEDLDKHTGNNEQNNLPKGTLLFNYYFFVDKQNYILKIFIENQSQEIGEIRIYIKNSKNIKEYKFNILPKNNIYEIPITGSYRQEKISLFAFSKKYDKIILKKIEVIRK
ncbi:MAG: hypothetical protein KatS3mg129_0560 [Leptospiraceae bacterium]|nr:MAG: hypothetical protein KatS3mg129_0560 [Leptospiraceae bacterium]